MIKITFISVIIFIYQIGLVFAENDTVEQKINSFYPFIYCVVNANKNSLLINSENGPYPKTTFYNYNNAMSYINTRCNNYFGKAKEDIKKLYSNNLEELNNLTVGIYTMSAMYTASFANDQALRMTGKDRKPKVGEFHVLPGGYKMIYTKSGNWQTWNKFNHN